MRLWTKHTTTRSAQLSNGKKLKIKGRGVGSGEGGGGYASKQVDHRHGKWFEQNKIMHSEVHIEKKGQKPLRFLAKPQKAWWLNTVARL